MDEDEVEEAEMSESGLLKAKKLNKLNKKKSIPLGYEEYVAKNLSSEAAQCQMFCSICAGGSSLLNNRIVMCDLCDAPFHQLCHYTPIDNILAEE